MDGNGIGWEMILAISGEGKGGRITISISISISITITTNLHGGKMLFHPPPFPLVVHAIHRYSSHTALLLAHQQLQYLLLAVSPTHTLALTLALTTRTRTPKNPNTKPKGKGKPHGSCSYRPGPYYTPRRKRHASNGFSTVWGHCISECGLSDGILRWFV